MDRIETDSIELDLLLEAIFRRYGYDFRSYARASIQRRTMHFLSNSGLETVADLIPRVLHDEEFFSSLARTYSITVTEMFRDPFFYRAVREKVLPLLRTWPHFKIWHAGCATGEEVYSLAILLREDGIYDRATIYATDFNDHSLAVASAGIYDTDRLRQATTNYQQAGGHGSFSEYYHARYNAGVLDASLKGRINFANHNLATDHVFGEMHLIFCRNVLIYFNRELQNRVLKLFTDSLVHGGFLCLGSRETLQFTACADDYVLVDDDARIYKKRTVQ